MLRSLPTLEAIARRPPGSPWGSRGVGVGGVPGGDGVDDRVGDVAGKREVGLTEVAPDHPPRLGLDLGDQRAEGKCFFGADHRDTVGEERSLHDVPRLPKAGAGTGGEARPMPVSRFPFPDARRPPPAAPAAPTPPPAAPASTEGDGDGAFAPGEPGTDAEATATVAAADLGRM